MSDITETSEEFQATDTHSNEKQLTPACSFLSATQSNKELTNKLSNFESNRN